jgi:hypothetical protein
MLQRNLVLDIKLSLKTIGILNLEKCIRFACYQEEETYVDDAKIAVLTISPKMPTGF